MDFLKLTFQVVYVSQCNCLTLTIIYLGVYLEHYSFVLT